VKGWPGAVREKAIRRNACGRAAAGYGEGVGQVFQGHDTPEDAARGSVPKRFTRVVRSERSGDRAVVLLEVNQEPAQYFDLSFCWLEDGAWVCDSEGGTGNEHPEQFAEWLAGSGADGEIPIGHASPEEAARGDIPEQFATVVWCERRGSYAVVLLQVSVDPPYFDLSRCRCGPWGWVADVSGNASGDERPDEFAHWLATGKFED
jgi:hypothetical protein